jgi:hypothetical protein
MYKVTLLVSVSTDDTDFQDKVDIYVVEVDGKLGVLGIDE